MAGFAFATKPCGFIVKVDPNPSRPRPVKLPPRPEKGASPRVIVRRDGKVIRELR